MPDPLRMVRDVEALTSNEFDLVVIGGGIFGAFAAWDAAQRGLSVALIERNDFGASTSANSYRIVHGGIRYLQHADVFRIRQSSNERGTFLRIAPHLVHPLPIVIPTYGFGLRSRALLRVGMAAYDLMTCDRNRGQQDSERRIPVSRTIDRASALDLFPALDPRGLTGGAVFHDGQIYNPPRLVLAVVQRAVEAGAVVANYVEAAELELEDGVASGVMARDRLSGEDLAIRGQVVLNATGPYAERLLARSGGLQLSPRGTYSRDACFVVPRTLLHPRFALAVQAKTGDPEAIVSRGRRHLFIAPWRDYTLIGTWHRVFTDDPDSFTVTREELGAFIEEVRSGYAALDISVDDVSVWNAGLVPFGDNPEGAVNLRYGHRSRLIDHGETHGVDNLLSLIGVRLTTGRYEAERAVDLVFRKLRLEPPPGRTAHLPIRGGDIRDWQTFKSAAVAETRDLVSPVIGESLARNYGTDFGAIMKLVHDDPSLGSPIGSSSTIRAQVVHAIRNEMAQNLSDIVFQRTDLATGEHPGEEAFRECAAILSKELDQPLEDALQQLETLDNRFVGGTPL